MTVYLFVRGIGLPDNFLQVYDNSFHLSVVQSMKHASSYSILSVGSYLEAGSEVFSPNASAGFYPAAWHIIAALVSRAFDISVMAAINLTNFVFAAFVLPLGVQSLIAALTKDDVQKGICAAVVTLAAVAFPWTLLYWGPFTLISQRSVLFLLLPQFLFGLCGALMSIILFVWLIVPSWLPCSLVWFLSCPCSRMRYSRSVFF